MTSDFDPAFELRIRPLRRGDDQTLDAVFAGLSEHSRYLRFHTPIPRLTVTMWEALLPVDGVRRLALVAEVCHAGVRRAGLAAFEAVFPTRLRQWDDGAIRLVAPLQTDDRWGSDDGPDTRRPSTLGNRFDTIRRVGGARISRACRLPRLIVSRSSARLSARWPRRPYAQ